MLNETDRLRARFAPNDSATFRYRRGILKGTIVRTNPKRAVVSVGGIEYTVPYELLIDLKPDGNLRIQRMKNIQEMALELMKQHGLENWQFRFDHSTRRAGCCNYRAKRISIAFELARNESETNIRDTILHEITHALVGRKHNHNAVWKKKALEIGCSGERFHQLIFSPPRYRVTCENRCWAHTAERRNTRLICRTCGGSLIYSPYSDSSSRER